MNTNIKLLALMLVVATGAGCRSVAGYRVPKEGVALVDPSGLQIIATQLKTSRRGFSATFDFVNDSDRGILVPFTELDAQWGGTSATTTVDPRRVRKMFTCADLSMPGSIDSGLFADTYWVTGSDGEPPRGEAIYVKSKSRAQGFSIQCTVRPQPGTTISVRWPRIYSGDAQGKIDQTVASNVTWILEPSNARD
ncbi:MAG: hypothetical protein KDC98_14710 [Planctomycetes bacterium]|nr:hypothetical protein [Planctomycetota bacterium]